MISGKSSSKSNIPQDFNEHMMKFFKSIRFDPLGRDWFSMSHQIRLWGTFLELPNEIIDSSRIMCKGSFPFSSCIWLTADLSIIDLSSTW